MNSGIVHFWRSEFWANLLSVGGASVMSQLIGLVAQSYSARVLGPEIYGLTAFGMSDTTFTAILLLPDR